MSARKCDNISLSNVVIAGPIRYPQWPRSIAESYMMSIFFLIFKISGLKYLRVKMSGRHDKCYKWTYIISLDN